MLAPLLAAAALAAPQAQAADFSWNDCIGSLHRHRHNGMLLVRRPHGLDLATASGRFVKRLTRAREPHLEFDATFSPDGRHVVFIRANNKGNIELGTKVMTVDVRTRRTRVIHASNVPGEDEWAVWSPDGRRIAFRRREEVPGTGGKERAMIVLVRPDGSDLVEFAPAQPNDPEVAPSRMLDWSPNGRCLALFTYDQQDDFDAVVVTDVRTDPPHPVSVMYPRGFQGGWPAYIAWAADGSRLFVGDIVGTHDAVIRSLNLRAGTITRVDRGGGRQPVPSPDGRLIAYIDSRGRTVARPLAGGRPRVLFKDGLLEDWLGR